MTCWGEYQVIFRSELTLNSPVSISIHWNKAKPVSISVGSIKNIITTFEAIRFLFKFI